MILAATSSTAGGIEPVLQAASAATGASFEFLLSTAQRESSLDPNARASTSSATGMFQFIESTWLEMIDRYGAEHGLGDLAEAISRNADGTYSVGDAATRRAILDLRTDPALSAVMAGELAAGNAALLEAQLGRPVTSGELYIAHFLGAGGASTLLAAAATSPDANAVTLFPAQAAANPGIFRTASGGPRTIAQVYDVLVSRHGAEPPVDVTLAFAAPDPAAATAPAGGVFPGWYAAAPGGAFDALFRTDVATDAAPGSGLWQGFATARGLFEVALAQDALLPSGAGLDLALDEPVGPLPTGSGPLDLTQFLNIAADEHAVAL